MTRASAVTIYVHLIPGTVSNPEYPPAYKYTLIPKRLTSVYSLMDYNRGK